MFNIVYQFIYSVKNNRGKYEYKCYFLSNLSCKHKIIRMMIFFNLFFSLMTIQGGITFLIYSIFFYTLIKIFMEF